MYRIVLQNKNTMYKVPVFIGCLKEAKELIAYGKTDGSSFLTSGYTTVKFDNAKRALAKRTMEDRRYIDKAMEEFYEGKY